MSPFVSIPDATALGEISTLSQVNLDALRTQHFSDTAPVSPVEGQLWTTTGVTKQYSGGAWHDLWAHGVPMLTMPHAADRVSDGAKYTLPWRASVVRVRVHHTSPVAGVNETTTLTFFDNGLAEEVMRMATGPPTAGADNIEVVLVIEDDGITLSRRNDTGSDVTLVDFSATGPIDDAPVLPTGLQFAPDYASLAGVLSAGQLLTTLQNNALAVRGCHSGSIEPVNPARYMLWAHTGDGWLYQLTAISPSHVWKKVIPLGKDLAFTAFTRFARYPFTVGPAGDGFDTAAFVTGFTPRAALVTVRCRFRNTETNWTPDVLSLEHDRTFLFVDPDLNTVSTRAPIRVSDVASSGLPVNPVEKTIQCIFGANSVDIDKLDLPVSAGDGFSTIKLLGVTVFS